MVTPIFLLLQDLFKVGLTLRWPDNLIDGLVLLLEAGYILLVICKSG